MNNKYKHLAVALSLVSAFFCLFGNTGRFELLSLLPLFWGGQIY